jgi:Carboxylesterase family
MRLPIEIRFLLSLSGLALAALGDASVALGSPSLPKVTVESGELEGTHFGSDITTISSATGLFFGPNDGAVGSERLSVSVHVHGKRETREARCAYHGEELYFLSNSYPTDWEHDGDDERLGQAKRVYWVQFAKTGNPNFNGLPAWPAYEPRKDQYLELGRSVGLQQVPKRVKVLGQIMAEVVADATGSAGPARSNSVGRP